MKSLHIRDFLRGEYKNLKEPAVVTKHGRPMGTWVPFGTEWQIKALVESGKDKTSSR